MLPVAKVQEIPGWLSEIEMAFLYNAAKQLPVTDAIVEIGSWKGRSTVCLGLASSETTKSKVYAIDPHVGSPEHQKEGKIWTFEEFKQNIARFGVTEYVVPVVKFSYDAVNDVPDKVKLLFIDGAHEYEAVKQDYDLYKDKVVDGGIIAFHDTPWPGVTRLMFEIARDSTRVVKMGLADNITYFTMIKKNTLMDRVVNLLFIAYARTRFFLRGIRTWLRERGIKV